nr:putative capsid [Picobirnavirus sp.]
MNEKSKIKPNRRSPNKGGKTTKRGFKNTTPKVSETLESVMDNLSRHQATNDARWWMKYPELSKDAANFVFNTIAGTKLDIGPNALNPITWPIVGLAMDITPTIGPSRDANDAFNYQMRALWLDMHRKYRGMGSYQSADLGMAIFAIINLFADIARAERVYGVASNFQARNRSYPTALLKAIGVDPTSITNGDAIADFRYQLNYLIAKVQTLCLPKGFSALDCYVGLLSNVFRDSENVRAQWFVYNTPKRIQFSATTFPTGSAILYVDRTHPGSQSLSDIIADLTEDIDYLLQDDDIARMCSDILAAYGDNGVTTLQYLPEEYTVDATMDDMRKLQLHNTTLVGNVCGTYIHDDVYPSMQSAFADLNTAIYQVDGVIKHQLAPRHASAMSADTWIFLNNTRENVYGFKSIDFPADQVRSMYYLDRHVVDTWNNDPSDEEKIDILQQITPVTTRNYVDSGITYVAPYFDTYGIYVVNSMHIWTNYNGGSNEFNFDQMVQDQYSPSEAMYACKLSQVDWHPKLIFQEMGNYSFMAWDIDNYSLAPFEAIQRVHESSTLSAFRMEHAIVKG